MATWDRRTPQQQAKVRDAALRRQLRDGVGPFSPFWRERFAALRVPASSIQRVADLPKLPAVGERDVCPDGDPADAARLVLQASEAGFAMHTWGPDLRKALVRRVLGSPTYRRQVEAEVRPTTFHLAGRAFPFPVASTRGDLDLVARAGNRAWRVLGLSGSDVLVSTVPVASRLDHVFLSYAALAAGSPAVFPGTEPLDVAEVLRVMPTTVLAVRPADAVETLASLTELGAELGTVATLLLIGAPSESERADATEALAAAGAGTARVLALYGPAEGRVLWAECAPGSGYHTYPDLDVVELVDPATGEPVAAGGEIAVTQLGFRGSALLRWRTGDIITGPIEKGACPSCRRTVPRIPSRVRLGPLQPRIELRGSAEDVLDLRAVAGALAGRADLVDWHVEVARSGRDGAMDLVLFVVPVDDESEAAMGAYRDVRAVIGHSPSQVVVVTADELHTRRASADSLSPRIVVRS